MEANRKFKASFFSGLFSEPNTLREVYNALADTNYGEETPVVINTLENVFFNDLKNDVSFTIDDKYVVLIEHQSTINSNMPLRCLMYIARVYEKITDDRAIYQEKLLKIPTPEFIVLYNGEKQFPSEKTLKLSEAYKTEGKTNKQSGNLDLTVRVININPGFNDELLRKSETLNGYSAFVDRVRYYKDNGSKLSEAINDAINWCMSEDKLKTFLAEHGSEASNMLMTEFNIDIAKEVWQEEAREDAYEEAREEFQTKIDEQAAEIEKQIAEREKQVAEIEKQTAEIERLRAILDKQSE